MSNEFKLVITGGGSGGHAMPAFSMVEAIKNHCKNNEIKCEILYIGSKNSIEENIARRFNVDFKAISTGKLRRYFSMKNFTDIFRIIAGLFQSLRLINKFKPDLLFSTGGFVSVPPVVAAKLLKTPIIIHEQTIDAGLANKIAAKFADKICITFPESKKYFPENKTIVTGIPLRDEIFNGSAESAKKRFDFETNIPVIFFYGGGLGCHLLNTTALEILPALLNKCNVIFQTGRSNDNKDYFLLKNYFDHLSPDQKKHMKLFDFIDNELGDILSITSLAVARSGAGTVCEFLSLKIPSIFIPLAIATNNEQYQNAMIMVKTGCAEIIEENDLNKRKLLGSIEDILFTGKLKKMKDNFKNTIDINGKTNLLKIILSYT